jgi:hypothetical protein
MHGGCCQPRSKGVMLGAFGFAGQGRPWRTFSHESARYLKDYVFIEIFVYRPGERLGFAHDALPSGGIYRLSTARACPTTRCNVRSSV